MAHMTLTKLILVHLIRDMSDSEPFSDDYPIDESRYSRKDYRMVAELLAQMPTDHDIRDNAAKKYADLYAADNPRFNKGIIYESSRS